MRSVLGLRELGREDLALAGGKGANLGELIKAGFDVPDGFVVRTEAYAAALESAQLLLPAENEEDPVAFREQVCRVPVPQDTCREIPPLEDADALVTGTLAGGGRVSGAVRIVREPSEFGTLQQGEILVCPAANPSWTPLFQRAAAVVVDTGGLASHAAIVAHEYGIPAIMGTGRGTSLLSTGQQVSVDGGSGRVLAHDPAVARR